MPSSQRIKKINELIKRELGKVILKEIDLPKDILVTITGVESSGNLQQSKVFVSVIPDKETKKVLEILKKEVYEFQQILNSRLRMRPVPKIRFLEEKELKEAERVEQILDKLKNQ